ncbi:hypothetical protein CHS0354_021532 [Potamilus streckersoni]|uniref:Sulfotransferase n=1 Tax=Potamilus streckersoni TaxID=2493646 RepID=A0AAE0SNW5_9BIVA|nr:hypothetical protein CHS0354_021532 [Potamilus streckersoni]
MAERLDYQPTKKAAFEKWDLILFSYMRSGSTVTSQALRESKAGTFFWFEPLIPLAPYAFFRYDKECMFRYSFCK